MLFGDITSGTYMGQRTDDLLRDLKVTSGCRMNAAERLTSRGRRMSLLTVFAAALVIALTVLPYLYKLPPAVSTDLDVVTLIMAIMILGLALFQYGTNDPAAAEQYRRCGLELGELHRELRNKADSIDENALATVRMRYDTVLQKYGADHTAVDLARYQVAHREDFSMSPLQTAQSVGRLLLSGNVLYTILTAAVAAFFLWLLFWQVLPARLA
jgi:SMODS and SLOG-associating 2TM effector domain family 5